MDTSAKNGYATAVTGGSTKRYCQTLDLRDRPELIAEYRRLHSEEGVWHEIVRGIRQAGILEMEIYLLGTRLFMIVETAPDFDWDTGMALMAAMPRQDEWQALTEKFQLVETRQGSTEKWKLMERIFHLYPSIS